MYAAGVLLAAKAAFFLQTSTENYLAQACTKRLGLKKRKKDFTSHKSLSFPAARMSGIDFLSKFEWHLSSLHSGKCAGTQVIYCLGCHKGLLCGSGGCQTEHAGSRLLGHKKRKGKERRDEKTLMQSGHYFRSKFSSIESTWRKFTSHHCHCFYLHTHVLENLYNDNKVNVYKSKRVLCVHVIIRFLFLRHSYRQISLDRIQGR